MKCLPVSSSSLKKLESCERWWYIYKVLGIKVPQDMSYADGGNVVHHTLEQYYENKITDIAELKKFFNSEWTSKYNLDNSVLIGTKKPVYWLMVLNSIDKNIKATDVELKIFFDDAVSYIDFVNKDIKQFRDHKSSTRTSVNEKDYKDQQLFYSWMARRHFGWIPESCVIDYLKYTGSKGEYEFSFTEKEINEFEIRFNKAKERMIYLETNKIMPPCKASIKECAHWCPYKQMCFEEKSNLLTFNLTEEGPNIVTDIKDPFLNNHIKKKFFYTTKNEIFLKKRFPNMEIGKTIYEANTLPKGCLKELEKTLNDYAEFKKKKIRINYISNKQYDKDLEENRQRIINSPLTLTKTLRDYQDEAVEAFFNSKYKRNIICLPTGSGKSLVMSEIIRIINSKTLILVERKELLQQHYDNLIEEFGEENVGIIQGKNFNPKVITVGTVQTLMKNKPEFQEFFNNVRFLVVEECHHSSSISYNKVNSYLQNLDYCLGISATPDKRGDGTDILTNAVCGYICYKKDIQEMIDNNYLVKPTINFISYIDLKLKEKEKVLDDWFDKLCEDTIKDEKLKLEEKEYLKLLKQTKEAKKSILYREYYNKFIISNEIRNNEIKKLVDNNKDKKILILVKSVKHGGILSGILNIPYVHGSMNKKERQEYFNDYKNNKINNMIFTYSLVSEGIDIPAIDIVINCTANSSVIKTIQILGRILRIMKGKVEAIYYDLNDPYKFLKFSSYKRKKIFREQGHQIK